MAIKDLGKHIEDGFRRVSLMHEKFNFSDEAMLDGERNFRSQCMIEEIVEFMSVHKKADQLDAMIDLIVFALGTIDRLKISPEYVEEAFKTVMTANENKRRGTIYKRQNAYDEDFRDQVLRVISFKSSVSLPDLVKPNDWECPKYNNQKLEADSLRPRWQRLGLPRQKSLLDNEE